MFYFHIQKPNYDLPLKKKKLVNDWEKIIVYWKESERSEVLANKCGLFQKHLEGLG